MTGINLAKVSYRYQDQTILADINLLIRKYNITCLIGPNGAGKSTLLKILAGLLVPTAGHTTLDDIAIHRYARKVLAKKLAYMPQQSRIPSSLNVREYVALGRFCHQSWFSNLQEHDHTVIEQSIQMTNLHLLADQTVATLSAGQQQRARIALMLAQQAEYLLLDEPMTGLDLKQQRHLLELLVMLQKHHTKTIILVLHDLQQALEIADEVVLLKNGNVLATGHPHDMITADYLFKMFECPFDILPASDRGAFYILPKASLLKC
jgi:iron complex transport system ATP-binding protein